MSITDWLDVAELRLEAFKTVGELQIELLEVQGEYQLNMMEALKKRVEAETDLYRLRMMQDAYRDYRNARRDSIQQLRRVEARAGRHETAARRIGYLALGETLSHYRCQVGWRGFWYLASQSPVDTVLELAAQPCGPEDREAHQFHSPRLGKAPTMGPDRKVTQSLALMDWARSTDVVPRLGSSAIKRLQELLQIMVRGADRLVERTEIRLEQARQELLQLRRANWETLEIQYSELPD